MKTFFALAASALAAASFVAADAVPAGTPAHFFSSQNDQLVIGLNGTFPGAAIVAATPGDGSADDTTALIPTLGTGQAGQLKWGDVCISANGIVPGSSSQTLLIDACSADPAQLWTVNDDSKTISNADGNCITLGRAAKDVPIVLGVCSDVLLHLQKWNAVPVPSQ